MIKILIAQPADTVTYIDIIINIDGREVFRAVLKEASEYKKQIGRSVLV